MENSTNNANKPWSQLVNAAHIDAVLQSLVSYPTLWIEEYRANPSWVIKTDEAWTFYDDNCSEEKLLIRNAIWDMVYKNYEEYNKLPNSIMNNGSRIILEGVTTALICVDEDLGHLLYSDVDSVTILAKLGDYKSIMLLSAVTVFAKIKELDVQIHSKNILR